MPRDITILENELTSENNNIRLKALKALLLHPGATPLLIVKCFCSKDISSGELQEVAGLLDALIEARKKLNGVEDVGVYRYLSNWYRLDPENNCQKVVAVLEHLCSPKALVMLDRLRKSLPKKPEQAGSWIDDACARISHRLKRPFIRAATQLEQTQRDAALAPLLETHATREQVSVALGGGLLDRSPDQRFGYEFDSNPELLQRAERYPGVFLKVTRNLITYVFFDSEGILRDYYFSSKNRRH